MGESFTSADLKIVIDDADPKKTGKIDYVAFSKKLSTRMMQ